MKDMDLTLLRLCSRDSGTLGALLLGHGTSAAEFLCWTLEDRHRDVKVRGETRIPAGRYRITLRAEGGFHQRYLAKFGAAFHRGMLWVRDVPGFEWILLHMGNTTLDTAGCVLLGNTAGFVGPTLQSSEAAYRRVYPRIADALASGASVWLNVIEVA